MRHLSALLLATLAVLTGSQMRSAGGAGSAWAQSSLPAIVQDEIRSNKEACAPEKSELSRGFIAPRDINGDGVIDYVLDYGKFSCGGLLSSFCGSGGCTMQVFASLPSGGYVKVLDENV